MQHPDNLNATVNRHIENQVLANRETLQTGMESIPVSTHTREPSEFPTCCLNFVNEFVRIAGVVLGYIPPDFIKVVFSLGALVDSQHQPFALFCCASSRLRPRALMAPTSKGVDSPLSKPFFISALSSSTRKECLLSRSSRRRKASRITSLAEP